MPLNPSQFIVNLLAKTPQTGASGDAQRQGEEFGYVYRLLDTLVNRLLERVGELPPELLYLRDESERVLRRAGIRTPNDEDELQGNLLWMTFYGNRKDLLVIKTTRVINAKLFPHSALRIDRTIEAIQLREMNTFQSFFTQVWLVCLLGLVCIGLGIVLKLNFPDRTLGLGMGLAFGFVSSSFLFREGFRQSRSVIARVCFAVAAILMLAETVSLIGVGSK